MEPLECGKLPMLTIYTFLAMAWERSRKRVFTILLFPSLIAYLVKFIIFLLPCFSYLTTRAFLYYFWCVFNLGVYLLFVSPVWLILGYEWLLLCVASIVALHWFWRRVNFYTIYIG